MFRAEAGTGAGLGSTSQSPLAGRRTMGSVAKRSLDVFVALLLLVLLLPLLISVSIAVAVSSGWPVIYSQKRVGRGGRMFPVYKFRSMRKDADQVLSAFLDSSPEAKEEWLAYQKLRNDPRVTRVGGFLRASSLDELPQLWNVIKGDMSLVGPRPVTTGEQQRYGSYWEAYCSMRPGISGMWQVNGRNGLTYRQRVMYDAAYVANWSFALDLKILMKTLVVVLRRDGSM